jgi:hypothetical protein
MKKIILLLLVIGFHQSVFAKVLTVRRYGYGGAFWNIEQAVDSANTGDTVYIDLRNETQYWGVATIRKNVTLSISDTSVSLNSLYIVSPTFKLENLKVDYLEFNGDNIEINQCTFQSGMEIKKGSCTINNSWMNYLMTYDTTSEVNLFNSFVTSNNGDGRCYLKGSKISVCGNVLGRDLVINSHEVVFNGNKINYLNNNIFIFRVNSESLKFQGNKILNESYSQSIFKISAKDGVFSNNYFERNPKNQQGGFDANSIFSISESNEELNNNPFLITNNYIKIFYTASYATGSFTDSLILINSQFVNSNILNFKINNIYFYASGAPFLGTWRNSLINLEFQNVGNWINLLDMSNIFKYNNFNSIILDSAYRLVYDSTLVINRGHDDPAFSDLDLSRNDIGPLGGPTPITNYQQTGGTNPRIWDVSLPRRTFYPSGSIPIRATGATK